MIKTSLRAKLLTVSLQSNNKGEREVIVVSETGLCWGLLVPNATAIQLQKGHPLQLQYRLRPNLKTRVPGSAVFSGIGVYRVSEQKQNATPEVMAELWSHELTTSGASTETAASN